MIFASVWETSSPGKARHAVSISKSTQPNAQMSARLSIGFPRACSGLMYAAVPRMTPACVIAGEVIVGDIDRLAAIGPECLQRLREPEVEHFHSAIRRDLDVGRFEIAVNDALFVRGLERLGDLLRDRQRFVNRDRATRDPLRQVLPGHELHSEGLHVARLFEAEDLRDVWVIQRSERLGFTLEAGHTVRVGRERLGQDLDRDGAIEARIAGFVDFAHAARADGGQDFVWTQAGAGIKSQGAAPDYTVTERRLQSDQRTGFCAPQRQLPVSDSRFHAIFGTRVYRSWPTHEIDGHGVRGGDAAQLPALPPSDSVSPRHG